MIASWEAAELSLTVWIGVPTFVIGSAVALILGFSRSWKAGLYVLILLVIVGICGALAFGALSFWLTHST